MGVKLNQRSTVVIRNEKGMATIEIIPLLILFVLLISYTMGAFGIVHTGIKNSIASRNYAFETFRNRSNLTYFRDEKGRAEKHFAINGNRTHGIMSEEINGEDKYVATERPLRVGLPMEPLNARGGNSVDIHNNLIFSGAIVTGKRNTRLEVNPVWLLTQYGICINVACGD